MVYTKKRKFSILVLILLLLAVMTIFTSKGKNSLKKRFIRTYDSVVEHVSVEVQHDWWRFDDFIHGYDKNISRIGWVTDIHADRFKRRTVESGTLFPRGYSEYLPKVFDDLRKQGIVTVLATGDNTNSGDEYYANELKKIAYRKNMQVYWVKGNHDQNSSMRLLDSSDDKFYYYKDFEKVRLIILDDTQQKTGGSWMNGGIGDEEMAWLNDALKTDKKVIISMHVPIFPVTQEDVILPEYVEFEKTIHDSGNVELVLAGHFHVSWNKYYDGISYYGESALTRENEKGGYGIIDLDKSTVNYFYLK